MVVSDVENELALLSSLGASLPAHHNASVCIERHGVVTDRHIPLTLDSDSAGLAVDHARSVIYEGIVDDHICGSVSIELNSRRANAHYSRVQNRQPLHIFPYRNACSSTVPHRNSLQSDV